MDPSQSSEIRTQDLAKEAKVSRQRIGQWGDEGLYDVARLRHGWFDRDKALAWIKDRRELSDALSNAGSNSLNADTVGELTASKIRVNVANAVWKELANAEKAGDLGSVEVMASLVMEWLAALVEIGDRECTRGTAEEQDIKRKLWFELRTTLCHDGDDVLRALSRAVGSEASGTQISPPMG